MRDGQGTGAVAGDGAGDSGVMTEDGIGGRYRTQVIARTMNALSAAAMTKGAANIYLAPNRQPRKQAGDDDFPPRNVD
jgi:hypothetical protein